MHPFHHVKGRLSLLFLPFSSYRRPGMLQVGLKLRKFLGWRDVTLPRIGTYTRHTKENQGERTGESFALFSACCYATQLSREMSIFGIIK